MTLKLIQTIGVLSSLLSTAVFANTYIFDEFDPLSSTDLLGDFTAYKEIEFTERQSNQQTINQIINQKNKQLPLDETQTYHFQTYQDINETPSNKKNNDQPDTLENYKPFKKTSNAGFLAVRPIIGGRMTSKFGYRRIFGRSQFHKGLDIAAPVGTDIFATGSGVVTYAGWMRGYGRLVEIDHQNGYKTRYAHNSRLYVKKGQHVKVKKHIADVGCSGRCTGAHLHYEIRKNGKAINPKPFIEKAPR